MSTTSCGVYSFIFLVISGVNCQIAGPPLNAIAQIGDYVTFKCLTTTNPATWWMSSNGGSADIYIAINCVIQPGYDDHYSVDTVGGNTVCNLIVTDITFEQAGVYTCSESGQPANTVLTVFDPVVAFVVYNGTHIYEDDYLYMTCTVNYNASVAPAPILQALVYWTTTDPTQEFTEINSNPNPNVIFSEVTILTKRPTVPVFTCNAAVVLTPTLPPPNYAANTPTDHYAWSSDGEYEVESAGYVGCGPILHDLTEDSPPPDGWDSMCYISLNDTDYVNTVCNELLAGMPFYNNAAGLKSAGGNFGCLTVKDISNSDQTAACVNNYQESITLSSCLSCEFLFVCITFP